jgi:DNA segregation ATPase FtsK/SpoIIIE-like protein
VLGLAEDGRTVFHNFLSHDSPHLFVVGDSGAGKTVLLRTIAVSLALNSRQGDVQLAVVCPASGDLHRNREQAASWLALNYLPHMLCDVAFRHTEIVDVLAFLTQEIAYRERHVFKEPRIILLVDQADVVVSRGGRQCAEYLQRLAQKGADAGIDLVLSARNVDRALFGPQLLTDVPVRIVGRQGVERADRFIETAMGADSSELLGAGDFFLIQRSRAQRMQSAYLDDYDLHMKFSEMYRAQKILLAQPLSTRVRLNGTPAGSPNIRQTANGKQAVIFQP